MLIKQLIHIGKVQPQTRKDIRHILAYVKSAREGINDDHAGQIMIELDRAMHDLKSYLKSDPLYVGPNGGVYTEAGTAKTNVGLVVRIDSAFNLRVPKTHEYDKQSISFFAEYQIEKQLLHVSASGTYHSGDEFEVKESYKVPMERLHSRDIVRYWIQAVTNFKKGISKAYKNHITMRDLTKPFERVLGNRSVNILRNDSEVLQIEYIFAEDDEKMTEFRKVFERIIPHKVWQGLVGNILEGNRYIRGIDVGDFDASGRIAKNWVTPFKWVVTINLTPMP